MLITNVNNYVLNYKWNSVNKEPLIVIGIRVLYCVKME